MKRRDLLKYSAAMTAGLLFPFGKGLFAEKPGVEHPIKNPHMYSDKQRCDHCGMGRNNWARTRHEFQNSKGRFYVCSIYCTAALSIKMKEEPENVKVAEYFQPEGMLDADKAVYVIGSAASGTMTRTSKIAFASGEEAKKYIFKYGGTVSGFKAALSEAKKEVQKPHHKESYH